MFTLHRLPVALFSSKVFCKAVFSAPGANKCNMLCGGVASKHHTTYLNVPFCRLSQPAVWSMMQVENATAPVKAQAVHNGLVHQFQTGSLSQPVGWYGKISSSFVGSQSVKSAMWEKALSFLLFESLFHSLPKPPNCSRKVYWMKTSQLFFSINVSVWAWLLLD